MTNERYLNILSTEGLVRCMRTLACIKANLEHRKRRREDVLWAESVVRRLEQRFTEWNVTECNFTEHATKEEVIAELLKPKLDYMVDGSGLVATAFDHILQGNELGVFRSVTLPMPNNETVTTTCHAFYLLDDGDGYGWGYIMACAVRETCHCDVCEVEREEEEERIKQGLLPSKWRERFARENAKLEGGSPGEPVERLFPSPQAQRSS